MTTHKIPPQEVLAQRLRYDPDSGKLFWLEWSDAPKGWNERLAGKEAYTCKHGKGYTYGTMTIKDGDRVVAYRSYSHRTVWKMAYGNEPEFIDHINGDRQDNRLENLRSVTRQENAINKRLKKGNKSGHHGVWETKEGSWRAFIGLGGKLTQIGTYPTKEFALVARQAAEKVLGFHENHGNY